MIQISVFPMQAGTYRLPGQPQKKWQPGRGASGVALRLGVAIQLRSGAPSGK
jgi:hypothetical protein